MLIVTLGDVLLDVIVRLEEPLTTGADATVSTSVGAGGQAANVAAWAVALGEEGRCVSRRGDDPAGALVGAELQARGVAFAGVIGGRTGVVVSLVARDGERTMASDRADAPALTPADLEAGWFACDCLHISGYALLASPSDSAAARAAKLARSAGARLSLDLSAWTRIKAHGPDRFRAQVHALAPDVIFGDEGEWNVIGDVPGARIVKRGRDGFDVVEDGRTRRCQAADAAVVDTTGAGDALAAGFLVGGPELAAEAAARCVQKLGAMP
jgi:sugar/nucleoside kinase (ribokinase family)